MNVLNWLQSHIMDGNSEEEVIVCGICEEI